MQHSSPVSGVAVHANLVATAGYDNRVLLWDLGSRRAIARGWHDHLANQCCFNATGDRLVTASSDYSARVWSVPDLRLLAVLGDHDDDVEMASFSPDGSRIATASRDHTARVFASDGALQLALHGHTRAVLSVEWSPCGSKLYTSSDDGSVRCWNTSDASQLDCYELDGTETDTIVLSADGLLIAGNDDGDVLVGLDSDGGRAHRGHDAGIKRLAISPLGRRLISAGYDQMLTTWSLEEGTITRQGSIPIPHAVWARTMAFADEDTVIFGSFGTSFAVLHLSTGAWDLDHIEPTYGLNALAVTSQGLATVGDAGTVQVDGHVRDSVGSLCNFVEEWQGRMVTGGHAGQLIDATTGKCLYQFSSPLNCAAVSEDGGRLIVGSYTGEGVVFATAGSDVEAVATVQLGLQAVKGVAVSSSRLFAVDAAGGSRCFDWPSLDPVFFDPCGHDGIANDVCALPQAMFATVSRDLSLRLWQDDQVQRYEVPLHHSLKCVAVDSGGSIVAVGAYDGSVALFDLARRVFRASRRLSTAGISDITAGVKAEEFWASSYDGEIYHISPDQGWV